MFYEMFLCAENIEWNQTSRVIQRQRRDLIPAWGASPSPAFSQTSSRDGKAPVRPGVSRRESDAGVYSHFKVDEQRIPLEWRDDLIVVADGW